MTTSATSTKHVKQHVQPTSGINQSHISELSGQPTFNTVNVDNTSPSELTVEPDSTYEHDKLLSFNQLSQPEPVFLILLDMEPSPLTPVAVHIHDDQLYLEDTTTIETPIIPVQNRTPNSPIQPANDQIPNNLHDNINNPSDDDYYIIEDYPSSPPAENNNLHGTQIINCEGDAEIKEDVENGWTRITNDVPPNNPQFTDNRV